MGWILAQRNIPCASFLGFAVISLITAGAAFDYLENVGVARMLRGYPYDPVPQIVDATRRISLVKWTMIFGSWAILSSLFFRRRDWLPAIGVYFLLVAGIGLVGVIFFHPVIEVAFALMAIGLFYLGHRIL